MSKLRSLMYGGSYTHELSRQVQKYAIPTDGLPPKNPLAMPTRKEETFKERERRISRLARECDK